MTEDEFWALYDEAFAQADTGVVQFRVTDQGVIMWKWSVTDWSPLRSPDDDAERARMHAICMDSIPQHV